MAPVTVLRSIILTLLVFLACSDSVTGPSGSPPLLFPLAPGARWEYSIFNSDVRGTTFGFGWRTNYVTDYGKAVLGVSNILDLNGNRTCVLNINLIIDSTKYRYRLTEYEEFIDTSYVQLETHDTSYSDTLVIKDGAVWYEKFPYLEPFLPASPGTQTKVNPDFFNFCYLSAFGPDLTYRGLENGFSVYFYYSPGVRHEIKALFNPGAGGLTELTALYEIGDHSQISIRTEVKLLSYTPGY